MKLVVNDIIMDVDTSKGLTRMAAPSPVIEIVRAGHVGILDQLPLTVKTALIKEMEKTGVVVPNSASKLVHAA